MENNNNLNSLITNTTTTTNNNNNNNDNNSEKNDPLSIELEKKKEELIEKRREYLELIQENYQMSQECYLKEKLLHQMNDTVFNYRVGLQELEQQGVNSLDNSITQLQQQTTHLKLLTNKSNCILILFFFISTKQ